MDYRKLLGDSTLYDDALGGLHSRVAVLDRGYPTLTEIVDYGVRSLCRYGDGLGKPNDHATFVASLLAGRNAVKGLCSEARILFGDVFSGSVAKPSVVARAIDCAVRDWRANVINLSLGFAGDKCPKAVEDACRRAYDAGTLIVSSAGNDGGTATWPAALPYVVCVGAEDGNGKADFSNGNVDFVAPGRQLIGLDVDGSFCAKTGTSFSAALLTGLAALVYSKNVRQGMPTGPDDILREIRNLCHDLGEPGRDDDTGYGTPFVVPVQRPSFFGRILAFLRKVF